MLSRDALKKLLALIICSNNGCISNFRQPREGWLSVKKQDILCCIPFSGTRTLLCLLKALLFTSLRSSCKHALLCSALEQLQRLALTYSQTPVLYPLLSRHSLPCGLHFLNFGVFYVKAVETECNSCTAALSQRTLRVIVWGFPG